MIRIIFFLIIFFNFSLLKGEDITNSIEADKIEYLNLDGKIKAIGSVKIIQNEYELNADEISFNQKNDIIEGAGNIILEKIGGEKIFASKIKLSSDLTNGIIENPTLQTIDGLNISSAYAIRSNGNSLILKKGIFSPCKICSENKRKLSWQVKANRIIYDENNENIIYEDARFELFGFPVFYVPIATHPTEKVKRRSGFLAPTLGTSGDLGAVVRVPYFFNLAPHYDLTITPWIVTKGAAIVEGEWRQRFKRGGINFSGIIASPNDKFKSRTVNINDDWQAIINSPFNDPLDLRENNKKLIFEYDDNTHSIKNVEVADINDNRPSSIGDAIGYDYRGAFSASGNFRFGNWKNAQLEINSLHFSTLLPEKDGSEPLILPEVKFLWNPEREILGGVSTIKLNSIGIIRKTDGNTYRLSSSLDWNRNFLYKSGSILQLGFNLRGDLYHTSKKWIPNNSTRRLQSNPFGKNQNIHRLLPSVSVEWRLPLKNAYSDTIVEPIIQLSYSSDNKKNYKIPNEDSIGFELNSHNIFAKNRMPGLDLWETGGKVSYGL